MTVYKVRKTASAKPPITINELEVDTSTALKLFGRKKLSYGKDLNENLLRLLESFACPEIDGENAPDKTKVNDGVFDNPTQGQLWFNSTPNKLELNVYDGTKWVSQLRHGQLAANWGVIADGEQIPLPVSETGRTYIYSECSWIVSPFSYPNSIDYMDCSTSSTGLVKMKYSLENSNLQISGYANYLIIGIPNNTNVGDILPPVGITPTPTATPAPTATRAPTPTPTTSISATPTPTPSRSVVVEVSPSPTPEPTSSPPPGVSPTPAPSTTPTPTPSTSFIPAVGLILRQGDGSVYGSGLNMSAFDNVGCCDIGPDGTNSGAAGTVYDSDGISVEVTGGTAPFTVTAHSWFVTPGSENSMFSEYFNAYGNFSGGSVGGNPLTQPVWTWTGGFYAAGGPNTFRLTGGNGACRIGLKNVSGGATITVVDANGATASQSMDWSYQRSVMDCIEPGENENPV